MSEDVPAKQVISDKKLMVECKRHGKHDAYIVIQVKGEATHHCAFCFREMLGEPLQLIEE